MPLPEAPVGGDGEAVMQLAEAAECTGETEEGDNNLLSGVAIWNPKVEKKVLHVG